MAYVTGKKMLEKARKKHCAVGAFNFSSLEAAQAIRNAAKSMNAPVIMATSENEAKHIEMESAVAIISKIGSGSKKPVALHLDHGKSFESIKKAIDAGYSSVHIDGSKHNYKKNLTLTKKCVKYAHKKGISIEGELGHIYGGSSMHKGDVAEASQSKYYTDPDEAKDFAEKTGVDSLAIAIGSVHGVWKSEPKLDFTRLELISKLTKLPIVLHGVSGIPNTQVKKAIKLGVAKINVNTELRVAYTDAVRKALLMDVDEVVPYNFLKAAVPAVQKVVEAKMKLFNA